MNLAIDHVLAALVVVPAIIAMAKATDGAVRILCVLAILCAVGAVLGPVVGGQGVQIDVGKIGWVACGIVAIIAGVRVANGALTSLMITGGVLGAVIELGIVGRH